MVTSEIPWVKDLRHMRNDVPLWDEMVDVVEAAATLHSFRDAPIGQAIAALRRAIQHDPGLVYGKPKTQAQTRYREERKP